jgi:nitronate monooxygenase
MKTRLIELIGCELPVQLAAMGGVGTTALAQAVVDAGGFGMVPDGGAPASGPCGVNFLMPFDPPLEEISEAAAVARVVEFFYDHPRRDVVDAAHAGGALAGWQVGSAEAAEAAGCDYVVVQGIEAGGHNLSHLPLDDVLAQAIGRVKVPVIAAGGVATAERFAEVMRAGADGVRVGTRFVTSPESGAHPDYVASLIAAGPDSTVLTEWFGEGWEHAPHRVLRAALASAERTGWRATMPPNISVDSDVSDMAMYAGTGVGQVTQSLPASSEDADWAGPPAVWMTSHAEPIERVILSHGGASHLDSTTSRMHRPSPSWGGSGRRQISGIGQLRRQH